MCLSTDNATQRPKGRPPQRHRDVHPARWKVNWHALKAAQRWKDGWNKGSVERLDKGRAWIIWWSQSFAALITAFLLLVNFSPPCKIPNSNVQFYFYSSHYQCLVFCPLKFTVLSGDYRLCTADCEMVLCNTFLQMFLLIYDICCCIGLQVWSIQIKWWSTHI